MALLLRGSREEKLTFVFSMYNESGSGSLGKEEVVTMIKLLQTSTLSQSLVRYVICLLYTSDAADEEDS
eukprot:1357301-Amorphochlora_amoeboformis.AAC.1